MRISTACNIAYVIKWSHEHSELVGLKILYQKFLIFSQNNFSITFPTLPFMKKLPDFFP